MIELEEVIEDEESVTSCHDHIADVEMQGHDEAEKIQEIQTKTKQRLIPVIREFIDKSAHRDELKDQLKDLKVREEVLREREMENIRTSIKMLEREIVDRFIVHHGRLIESHISVREQDELIRKSRDSLLHGCNKLSQEKKVIREMKQAEERRKINDESENKVANVEWGSRRWMSKEYMEAQIKGRKMSLGYCKMEMVMIQSQIVEVEKYIKCINEELVSVGEKIRKINQAEDDMIAEIFNGRSELVTDVQ